MTFDEWWDTSRPAMTPDTFAGWEQSCRQAWNAGLTAALSDRERAIAEAVTGEREASALVCDALAHDWRGAESAYLRCAEAIRARSGAKG